VSKWRLISELPQPRNQEEARAQSVEGWNPWSVNWTRSGDPDIVVPDPRDPSRRCHLQTFEVERAGTRMKFAAAVLSDRVWRFYLPAPEGTAAALEAVEPKYDGYWRASYNEDSELPWPGPEQEWTGRATFLIALDRAEAEAERIVYRGKSSCRLCGGANGHVAFRLLEWEWPSGYRHYILDHDVRPSADFEWFILNRGVNGNPSLSAETLPWEDRS
jgi:hypothetical protein